jgi:UDP-N-acetylmuramate dehydrogenase
MLTALDGLSLMARLPKPRGVLTPMRRLDELTWLRVGGPAEVLFQPADPADLGAFLARLPGDVPVTVLGVGSNLIVRDGGVPGVCIRLGRGFMGVKREGQRLRLGAAVLDAQAAKAAGTYGIAGLEFLRTIPGAIGGAVAMNAGCYGRYIADVFVEATVIDRSGAEHRLLRGELSFAYRDGGLPEGCILTEAVLQGAEGEPAQIMARMEALLARRAETQPVRERTAGSTFRNPAGYSSTGEPDDTHELKAWALIDRAGCRGLRLGGAQISPMHSNFLVNTGNATAADLENLGEMVRSKVLFTSGLQLEWEVRRIGVHRSENDDRREDGQTKG